jgi:glycosyltransferase involved in cell wall biosynthesis
MPERRPLRVAVVTRAVMPLHGVGGLERATRDLVRHLAARGVDVTLITPPPSAVGRASGDDPFASPRIRLRHVRYVTFPFANRPGTTVLDRSTAYLVYGWRAGRLAASLAAAGDVDLVHGSGASVLGYAMARARGTAQAPLVFNPHGMEEFGATAGAAPAVKRLGYAPLRWAVRRTARAADCIIATDRALEPMVARHLKPRPEQVRTIPNGIDLLEAGALAGPAEGATLRHRAGIGGGETILLSVGRLEMNKGLDVLAAALARAARPGSTLSATGWRWVIVGAGPFRRDLERAVAAHGLGAHVIFAGRASDAELHAWYEAASIFVHPTRYEGSSLVTLEAMAHRRPIVAAIAGGLPDKVRPGVNGWLIEPGDADALAGALEDAVSSPARLAAFGAASRAIVEREFAWSVLVDRQIDVYRELLDNRRDNRHPDATSPRDRRNG